jgi:hypothetical protein
VLTNTKAAEIGITTIKTASTILLRNAPKEGVIL